MARIAFKTEPVFGNAVVIGSENNPSTCTESVFTNFTCNLKMQSNPAYSTINSAEIQQISAPSALRGEQACHYLTTHGWPQGLQTAYIRNLEKLPMRFFIVDDSGSMVASDGHRLVGEGANRRILSCTRWAELSDSIRFHAGFAEASGAVTQFRLLNSSLPLTVGRGDDNGASYGKLLGLLENSPAGGTPLCRHITEVIQEIRGAFALVLCTVYCVYVCACVHASRVLLLSNSLRCAAMEPFLRATNQRVTVTIATDGESSDGDIASAMRPLQSLPVWVVIRLCTDQDSIVDYWNNIDKVLGELRMLY